MRILQEHEVADAVVPGMPNQCQYRTGAGIDTFGRQRAFAQKAVDKISGEDPGFGGIGSDVGKARGYRLPGSDAGTRVRVPASVG